MLNDRRQIQLRSIVGGLGQQLLGSRENRRVKIGVGNRERQAVVVMMVIVLMPMSMLGYLDGIVAVGMPCLRGLILVLVMDVQQIEQSVMLARQRPHQERRDHDRQTNGGNPKHFDE
ncbi:MAG: hypothetical protein ACI8UO_005497 [Verrucomicrobiales bacterium]|jgi:hypothetical protein